MNEKKLVRFVTRHLDAGTTSISDHARHRLAAARQLALSHQAQGRIQFAGIGSLFHVDLLTQRALAKMALALVLTLGVAYWHAQSYIHELEELDSAILTDELPIDVITDKGFDAWLKSSVRD